MKFLLPKGVKILEQEEYNYELFQELVQNLQSNSFSGYIYIDMKLNSFYIIFKEGYILIIFQTSRDKKELEPIHNSLLNLYLEDKEFLLSYYTFSPKIAEIASSFFCFKEVYTNFSVINESNFKTLLDSLEKDEYSGFLEIACPDLNRFYVVVDRGLLFMDNFVESYEEIKCQEDILKELFNLFNNGGCTVTFIGARMDFIDSKRALLERKFLNFYSVYVNVEKGGLFAASNTLKINPYILEDRDINSIEDIKIYTSDGKIYEDEKLKVKLNKKFSEEEVSLSANVSQKLGLTTGDRIVIYLGGGIH